VIDKQARADLRASIQKAQRQIDALAVAQPAATARWAPFREQLAALADWLKGDALPEPENLDRITLGNMALRELGETRDDTPPELRPLRQELISIQNEVMNFYAPFP